MHLFEFSLQGQNQVLFIMLLRGRRKGWGGGDAILLLLELHEILLTQQIQTDRLITTIIDILFLIYLHPLLSKCF